MLPWIIGAVVVGMILDDTESEKHSAKKNYNNEYNNSIKKINHHHEYAIRKDTLDKLFKVKRAKQKIANNIYSELKSYQDNLREINTQIKKSKKILSALFYKKRLAWNREEKRIIQNDINILIETRREIFKIKDNLKSNILELRNRLKDANNETKAIQNEINKIV